MKRYLLCLLTLLMIGPAHAWDKMGHMVVAQIAYDTLLNDGDTKTLDAMDLLAAQFNADSLAHDVAHPYPDYNAITIAAWMDDVKDWNKSFNREHYIDLPCGATNAEIRKAPPPNVFDKLGGAEFNCIDALHDYRGGGERARAFAFLMHLAGDIHQPYHCYAPLRGGNDFKIALDPPSADFDIPNLHILWDTAYKYDWDASHRSVVLYDPLLRSERTFPRDRAGMRVVRTLAREIRRRYPTGKLARESDVARWVLESNKIACEQVPPSGTITPAYIHNAHDIACQRMALAGYRLARLLRTSFN